MDERRRLGDRLDDARLVVRALQRQARGPGGGRRPRASRDRRVRLAGEARFRRGKPMPGEDADMLARPDDQPLERWASASAEKRIERRVRGLRAAGNEGYATGPTPASRATSLSHPRRSAAPRGPRRAPRTDCRSSPSRPAQPRALPDAMARSRCSRDSSSSAASTAIPARFLDRRSPRAPPCGFSLQSRAPCML